MKRQLYKPVLLGCGLFWLAAGGVHSEVEIPLATDLQADGLQARFVTCPNSSPGIAHNIVSVMGAD